MTTKGHDSIFLIYIFELRIDSTPEAGNTNTWVDQEINAATCTLSVSSFPAMALDGHQVR